MFIEFYKKNIRLAILFPILCFFLLSSCATTPEVALPPLESLRISSTEYWKLRMADKYEETYKMEYRDALPPYTEYLNIVMAIKKFSIVKHEIKNVNIEGDKGFVDVEFSFILPPVTKPFVQTIKDEWVFIDGKWLHKISK